MPTLADLFPNLAKLKKDAPEPAPEKRRDRDAMPVEAFAPASTFVADEPESRGVERSAKPTELKVGGPSRARRGGRGEAPTGELVREWSSAEQPEAGGPAGPDGLGLAPGVGVGAGEVPHGWEREVAVPEVTETVQEPAVATPEAPEPVQQPAGYGATLPVEYERRSRPERRSGGEERGGGERRFGVEARSGSDRRGGEDSRSGGDLRSGGDRRATAQADPEGFTPLAAVAKFGMDKLSGRRRGSASDELAAVAVEPVAVQALAPESADGPDRHERSASRRERRRAEAKPAKRAKGASDGKRASGPLAAAARSVGNMSLSSLKNANVTIGRGGGRSASLVGLDIQPGYVAAVEADVNGVVAVKRAVGLALPPDTMREGEVVDPALLAEVLQELFAKGRLSKRVRIGLANQRTVVRTLELPPIEDRKELESAVNFMAADQIPMPLANAVIDFQPLGIVETPAGRRQRVVVVAAQREMVERLVNAVSAAGLRPEAVDLSAFAMIRALYRPDDAPRAIPPVADVESLVGAEGLPPAPGVEVAELTRQAPETRTLFLNVGGLTNLAIAEGSTCRFTRAVGGGLESMATALSERRSMPLVDARAAVAAFDLSKREPRSDTTLGARGGTAPAGPGPLPNELAGPEQPSAGERDPGAASAEVRAVIGGGLREIAGEVRNSLDFHRAQERGGTVDRVVLSGAALEINGFASALETELGFRVERRAVASSRGGDLQGMPAERLAVAAGLAVEEVGR